MSYRNVNTQIDILRQLQKTISQNIDTHAAGVEELKQKQDSQSQIIDVQSQLINVLSQKLDIHVAYVETMKQMLDNLSQKQDYQSQLIDTLSQKVDSPSDTTLNNRLTDIEQKINTYQFPDLDNLQKYLESNTNLEFELQYKL